MVSSTKSNQSGTSEDTKTIVTVLLLIFVPPVGWIVMLVWPKWPTWVKLLISAPLVIAVLGIIAAIVLVSVNPYKQMQKAKQVGERACVTACNNSYTTDNEKQSCITQCSIRYSLTPAISPEASIIQ